MSDSIPARKPGLLDSVKKNQAIVLPRVGWHPNAEAHTNGGVRVYLELRGAGHRDGGFRDVLRKDEKWSIDWRRTAYSNKQLKRVVARANRECQKRNEKDRKARELKKALEKNRSELLDTFKQQGGGQ